MTQLHDYQQYLLRQVEAALNASEGARVMMQAPTGAGKTVIAGELLKRRLTDGRRAVWLTHRKELAAQTCNRLNDHGVAAMIADRWKTGADAPELSEGVLIFMAQTVGKRTAKMEVWNSYTSDDLMVIDEAHHAPAKGWERAMEQWPGPVVGMTATPWRMKDEEGFVHLFDQLIHDQQVVDLQSSGHLCDAKVLIPSSDQLIRGGRRGSAGDYTIPGIERANSDRDVMTAGTVRFWQSHASDRQTIVYAVSVGHAHNLVALFKKAHIQADLIEGKTPAEERDRIIEAFRIGDLKVLVNVEIATEGFDLPDASCVVITRPTLSLALFMQMMGRGLRPKDDGGDCLILDLAANSVTHGLPEEHREWSLDPRGKQLSGEAWVVRCLSCEAASPAASHHCTHCGEPFGKECGRCAQWRTWKRWCFENLCGDAHQRVCDRCHNDAHIAAHLPLRHEINTRDRKLDKLLVDFGFRPGGRRLPLSESAGLLWAAHNILPEPDDGMYDSDTRTSYLLEEAREGTSRVEAWLEDQRKGRKPGVVADLLTVMEWHRWLVVAINVMIDSQETPPRRIGGRLRRREPRSTKRTDFWEYEPNLAHYRRTGLGLKPKPDSWSPDPLVRSEEFLLSRDGVGSRVKVLDGLKSDARRYESLRARIERDATIAASEVADLRAQDADEKAKEFAKKAEGGSRKDANAALKASARAEAWRSRARAYDEAAKAMLAGVPFTLQESLRCTYCLWWTEGRDRVVIIDGGVDRVKHALAIEMARRCYQVGDNVALLCHTEEMASQMKDGTQGLPNVQILSSAGESDPDEYLHGGSRPLFDYVLVIDEAHDCIDEPYPWGPWDADCYTLGADDLSGAMSLMNGTERDHFAGESDLKVMDTLMKGGQRDGRWAILTTRKGKLKDAIESRL